MTNSCTIAGLVSIPRVVHTAPPVGRRTKGTAQKPGNQQFEELYSERFRERWSELRSALLAERSRTTWCSPGYPPYTLDRASRAVAHLLPLGPSVADLCAAPGGKTLILAHRMHTEATGSIGAAGPPEGGDGEIIANDLSRHRGNRLRAVLETHLPPSARAAITVTCTDASRWGIRNRRRHHAILVDAPCSSERHVLEDPQALGDWSPARVRHLAQRQYALLAGAVDSLQPGGHVLYVTCALLQEENELVVRRVLERGIRREEPLEVIPLDPHGVAALGVHGAELRNPGLAMLPDRCGGAGPMYCALLRRGAPAEL